MQTPADLQPNAVSQAVTPPYQYPSPPPSNSTLNLSSYLSHAYTKHDKQPPCRHPHIYPPNATSHSTRARHGKRVADSRNDKALKQTARNPACRYKPNAKYSTQARRLKTMAIRMTISHNQQHPHPRQTEKQTEKRAQFQSNRPDPT